MCIAIEVSNVYRIIYISREINRSARDLSAGRLDWLYINAHHNFWWPLHRIRLVKVFCHELFKATSNCNLGATKRLHFSANNASILRGLFLYSLQWIIHSILQKPDFLVTEDQMDFKGA